MSLSVPDQPAGPAMTSVTQPSLSRRPVADHFAILPMAQTVGRLFGAPSRRVDSRSYRWLKQSAVSSVRPVGGSIRDHTCGSNSRPSLRCAQSAGRFAILPMAQTVGRLFGAPSRRVDSRSDMWLKQSAVSSVRPVSGSIRDPTDGSNSRPSLRCAQSAGSYGSNSRPSLRCAQSAGRFAILPMAQTVGRLLRCAQSAGSYGSNSRPSLWCPQSAHIVGLLDPKHKPKARWDPCYHLMKGTAALQSVP